MATVKKESVKKITAKKPVAKTTAPSLRTVKRSNLEILEAPASQNDNKAAFQDNKKKASLTGKVPVTKKAESRKLKVESSLSAPIFDLTGKAAGTQTLPKEVFGVKVNQTLLSHAMRVYMNNQKSHFGNTKTRGEVQGSTRKIYKQKGTGGARHGARRAPIFVGGGISMGPKYRKIELKLPQKMKNAALVSALSQKLDQKQLSMLTGLEKASGKTQEMAKLAKVLDAKSLLFVSQDGNTQAFKAVRNIPQVEMVSASNLNAFEVIKAGKLILTQEAVDMIVKRVNMEGKNA